MTVTKQAQWDRPADRMREGYEAELNRLRAQKDIRPEILRARIAKVYLNTKAALDAAAASNARATAVTTAAAKRAAYGVDDLKAGVSHAAQATIDVSFRDAHQRAATITRPTEAQDLLDTAEATGDELLARAVGNRGIALGLTPVAEAYLASRPGQAAAMEKLRALARPASAAKMFEFITPKPAELTALTDAQIAALAGT